MTALTIAWKEFRSFLNSPVAFIFLIIFLLYLAGAYFIWGAQAQGQRITFFTLQQTSLAFYFYGLPVAFAILVPALSMRLWPDELKLGTVELLLSYPLKTSQIVLGKFLAGLGLIAVGLLLTLAVPLTVSGYGSFDWGPVFGAYGGALMMGAAFLSVGLFMGALCKEQVTAFIITAVICVILVTAGDALLNQFIPESWHGLSNALSFTTRFRHIGTGVVSLTDVVYFTSFTVLFLVLNVTVIECRKGR